MDSIANIDHNTYNCGQWGKYISKLKLIKTYLRSTISQSRLTNLAIMSIENEIAKSIDFDVLLKEIADRNARKVKFY